MTSSVGIVVPTLGTRPDFLKQTLDSIRRAGDAHILIVGPEGFAYEKLSKKGLCDSFIPDPGSGLPGAINAGIASLPNEVTFVNWIGDDDVLTENSLIKSSAYLENNPDVVCVFGAADYIDENGEVVWRNKSGQWAAHILRFGPDLIPQPGALYRRDAFTECGGVDSAYKFAFDFDLLIKLSLFGRLEYIPETLASFRWHSDSLTVSQRKVSVAEASRVRVDHLPKGLRPFSPIWEVPLKLITLWAGALPSQK